MASLNNDLWIKNFYTFKRYVCANHILPFKYNTVISESGTDVFRWFLHQRYKAEKGTLDDKRLSIMSDLLGCDWYRVPMLDLSCSLYKDYVFSLKERDGLKEYSLKITDLKLSSEDVVLCARSSVVYLDDMFKYSATKNIISNNELYSILINYSIYNTDYWRYLLYEDLVNISLKSIYTNRLQPCLSDIFILDKTCSRLLSKNDYTALEEYYSKYKVGVLSLRSLARFYKMSNSEYNRYISGIVDSLSLHIKSNYSVNVDVYSKLLTNYNTVVSALNSMVGNLSGYNSKYDIVVLFTNELGLKLKDAICLVDMLFNFTDISTKIIKE